MKQLSEQQLRFAPVSVRLEQIGRTEELLVSLHAGSLYPYPAICEQITEYRSEMYPDLEISGDDLLHDLRCFVEDLSDSADLSADSAAEQVLTVEEVSRRFNVSTKTVNRWRDRGLASRRFRFGNRKRVGFLQSSVERFLETHRDKVDRGAKFQQLSESDREFIIRRARRLARVGASLTEITHRLSRRTGRAIETIRYTLKAFDQQHPQLAVFPDAKRPLRPEDHRTIFHALRRGVPASRLAARYGRTKSSIHRIANEFRVRSLAEQPIDYIESDEFDLPDADERILDSEFSLDLPGHGMITSSAELPEYLADLYASPVLTREQEQYLFRKMNYLKHKARIVRDGLKTSAQRAADMDRLEELLKDSLSVKNALIRCNLRLVVSVARKHRAGSSGFFEMISDGNMTLLRAIEKFDYRRGNKFSTYATWAIMRSYARSIPAEGTQLSRFRTGSEELITDEADARTTVREDERKARWQQQAIESIIDQLNEREQEAISLRFALRSQPEPLTLEQIGDRLGVSKERTRQIINAGLEKLRDIAEEAGIELPTD